MMAYTRISKCRTCLAETQNMKLLTADYLVCGELLTISDIITACTSIQIINDEKFPNYICDNCLQDANTAYSFKKRCEQSENFLKSQLEDPNKVNKEDVKYGQNFILLPKFLSNEETESYFQCNKCPVKFTSQVDLNKHVSSIHDKRKIKYKCNFCNKSFTSEAILNKHMYSHASNTLRAMRKSRKKSIENISSPIHFDEDNYSESDHSEEEIKQEVKAQREVNSLDALISELVDTKINTKAETDWFKILKHAKEKNEDGLYECLCCSETVSDTNELRKHMTSHTAFKCKLCKKKFTLLSNLRRHYKLHDTSEAKFDSFKENISDAEYKCIACQKVFTRRKFLSEHLKTHKEFNCPICNAKFSYATNLRKHISWHNRPKDAVRVWKQPPAEKRTCDICFKVFKYRPSMLKHRKKHEFSGKTCKFCDKIFENAIKLYKHMEENHEHEKNVICSVCGKKFFREWNLKMHMIVHTGVKPYMCEICGASFALGGNLASHKRLHTGHKPYKCSTCGRGFTQQAALRSHEAGHSDRRDFICPDCGAAFSRAGAMRNHRKRHQSARPFPCGMCGKRFTFSSERKRHMTIHTGEKNYICDFCGKAFNRPTNLTVHRRIHTGECPYKCDVCGKGFVQAHCMRTHRNTHREVVANQHIVATGIPLAQDVTSTQIIVPQEINQEDIIVPHSQPCL